MRGVAGPVISQIGFAVRPILAPSRAQQHDGARFDPPMTALKLKHIRAREAMIPIGLGLVRHIDDHSRSRELCERDRLYGWFPLAEVDRRIDMGTAVLGSAECVGHIEIAALGVAVRQGLEFKLGGSGWPVDRVLIK